MKHENPSQNTNPTEVSAIPFDNNNPPVSAPEKGTGIPFEATPVPKKTPHSFKATVKRLCTRWFIDAFGGMAMGLFATLIIGLIIKQLGLLIGDNGFGNTLVSIGAIASALMGAGIGAGIAGALKADKLVLFSTIVAGFLGAQAAGITQGTLIVAGKLASVGAGDPIGAYVAALVACEIGLLVKGKTKLDIIVVPLAVILSATAMVFTLCPPIIKLIALIGQAIATATELQPFVMGVILSISVGILLTMPTSSAAICIAMSIPNGLANAAAAVGCAAHMVGFAVMSFRENRWGGLIAQGLGTSMLQIPNIFKKPVLLVPPVIASAIVGPLSTCLFKLHCDVAGSGMGTAGLVGVIGTISESIANGVPTLSLILGIILLFFVLPGVISLLVCEWMRKKNIIKFGDLKLDL